MAEKHLGVYGLEVTGLPMGAVPALTTVPPGSARVDIELRLGSSPRAEAWFDADRLVLAYEQGARYEIWREPGRAVFTLPTEPSPEGLVHPLLTVVASSHARWRGALTLHGGSYVVDGRAVAVLADKDGGKSSALAGLADRGVSVLTDDLVVVEAGNVLPGPRTVDLRPEAAATLGAGTYVGHVGGRERHRVALPDAAAAPLAAVVLLEWGDEPEPLLLPMELHERVHPVHQHEALSLMGEPDSLNVLDVVTRPFFRLRRPRDWRRFEDTLDALGGVLQET